MSWYLFTRTIKQNGSDPLGNAPVCVHPFDLSNGPLGNLSREGFRECFDRSVELCLQRRDGFGNGVGRDFIQLGG